MASKSPTKATEHDLVASAYSRLARSGDAVLCMEVPTLGRAIDLVLYKNRTVTSVEFKLKNWKRALNQARDHRLVADYAYVCMPPKKNIPKAIEDNFRNAGVGLLFYSGTGKNPFMEIIPAPKSREVWAIARRRLIAYVKGCVRQK